MSENKRRVGTRRFVMMAVIAALYVVLTLGLAPISYGVIQFRVSEALKAFVLFDPFLSLGIGVGTFIANIASPYAGPWEFVWMPLTDMLGGLIAWAVYVGLRRSKIGSIVSMVAYAITTGLAVGLMLQAFGLGGFWILSAGVVASELIILLVGLPIIMFIGNMLKLRGLDLTATLSKQKS